VDFPDRGWFNGAPTAVVSVPLDIHYPRPSGQLSKLADWTASLAAQPVKSSTCRFTRCAAQSSGDWADRSGFPVSGSRRKLAGIVPHKLMLRARGNVMRRFILSLALIMGLAHPAVTQEAPRSPFDALIATHAKTNGIPESLVHRVILRESRYDPRAVGRGGTMGLMQIKHATARGLGYAGPVSGLLDPETNLTYAVRYLAGAYRAAAGNPDLAVSNFRRGYYRPKRKGPASASVHSGGRPPAVRQNAEASSAR
jgi:soluble lytic murein transglycosylase-like protein